ncbi:acyltransferase family protein [Fructilactobacillus fructivorans]|uniref:acyltransferase family protein n=1 Tax=Fructilactobacillus fructivorans TaxID=1614 RepID=UPI0002196DAB|nr:acyltransferase [Fructilactobacillus fructivorans]KRK58169.1 acyltransferase [Fructilactobacillus fructivorans]
METNTSKNRFITGFTGLRALAVICVILYHLNQNIFSGGYLGVPVFLTLSGYLVTDHLINEYQSTGHFRYGHFWYKRLKRLYPTLIVMLFATATYITLFQRNLLANLWQSVVTNLAYVYNWYEIANGQSYFQNFAGSESPFTHLWTLAIEGQFYLIWPLIIVILLYLFNKNKHGRLNKKSVFFVAIGLSILSAILMAVLFKPGTDPSRVYYGTDTRMFSILLGAALAVIWPSSRTVKNSDQGQKIFFDIVGLVGVVGMVWLIFTVGAQSKFLYRGGMVLFSLFTVLIMWAILSNIGKWNWLMTNPIFDWIGSRSYEIYVYQLPVFIFFEDKFKNVADHQLLYAVIEILLIVGISELSYRFVEVPFGKYDYKQLFSELYHFMSHTRIREIILGILAIIGGVGILQSTTVNPKQANHTELANRIQKNAKTEKENNKNLAKDIKSGKKVKSSNKDQSQLEKNGLTAAQVKEAQNLSGTAVGDSVMLAGHDDLQKIFPVFTLTLKFHVNPLQRSLTLKV